MKNLRWRTIVVVFTVVFSIYLLIPTFLRFSQDKPIPKVPKDNDPWYYAVIPSEVLKLGLDLRGGIHLVLGINYAEVKSNAALKLANELKDSLTREKIEGPIVETGQNDTVTVKYQSDEQWDKIDRLLFDNFRDTVENREQLVTLSRENNLATLGLSPEYITVINDRAREQSLETIRNRIDEFGLAEPIIQPHGTEKILVQFPGVGEEEIGRIKSIIARTAKLSFQIVRTGDEAPGGDNGANDQGKAPNLEQLNSWIDEYKKTKNIVVDAVNPITKHLNDINAYLAKRLPPETEVIFHKATNVNTREVEYKPYILNKEHIVDGEELEDAYQGYKQDTGDPIVNFSLNGFGASKFEKATGENVGRFMAIILDRNVHSAPRINGRIPGGRAIIEMGRVGGKTVQDIMSDAKDTALVLRSGALPARLEFLEERSIGPSLGADSIRAGSYALGIGMVMVLIFMAIYYRFSGILAVVALLLNGLFVLAAMAAFEGTLTLPGIAGLTLTLGMAVDANVLIFEHIREELRLGKSVNMAIAEGYRRAFTAIFDSNITTMLAALVLMSFGYGPIRGFAVTLLIGLVASMYTAVFVTRLIIDYTVVSRGKTALSI